MGRSLEGAVDHRLQHIVLDHAELRLFDAPLFDTATGVDCAPRTIRSVIRCLPTNITPAVILFGDDCTMPVPVVEVPQRTCERFTFASTSRPFQIHSIAGPVSDRLFRPVDGVCTPYTPASGMALHALGAALDPAMFLGGVYFSERNL
jgi:hypothetical protein